MRWVLTFAAFNATFIAVVLVMLWVIGGFEDSGLSTHGWVALLLGITLTSALGVALMALVFHSARKDYDDDAHGAGRLDT
jgi:ABC-type multidrug transport system permease subunit